MFCGSASHWSKGFARLFLNPIEHSDWSAVFLVEKRRVLEYSKDEKASTGLFFGDLVPEKCPYLVSKNRPEEQFVSNSVCWVFEPVQQKSKSVKRGAHDRILWCITGEDLKRPNAGFGKCQIWTLSEIINRLLSSTDLRWEMTKTTPSDKKAATSSSSSKLPVPESFLKAKETAKPKELHSAKKVKRQWKKTRSVKQRPKVEKSEESQEKPNSEDSWSETEEEMNNEIEDNPIDKVVEEVGGALAATNILQTGEDEPIGMTADWAEVAKDANDGPIFDDDDDIDVDETVLERFGVNEALKNKIAQLIESEVLPLEVDEFTDMTIEEKDFVELRKKNKTTTTRFTLVANAEKDFIAERPSQDIVDELLFLATGLGLPIEIIAQKPALINKDAKERRVNGAIFPTGLKQKWELQVSSWVDLNLNIVCGKRSFDFGSGKDKWKVFVPGAYRDDEKSFYAHGICSDPTITNTQIAKQLMKQGYEILQGAKGVKDSPNQGNFGAKSGGKYFFLKTEMEKKSEDEYHKIHIAVWSENRKAKVQISFSVREKSDKSKKEATETATKPKRCVACGNGEDKCSGHLGTNCSWKDVIISEWFAKKKALFEGITPFVKGATFVQAAPVNEAEQKVKKYMSRVEQDDDQERQIRIRHFLAHNVKIEVQKEKLGENKSLDDAGFVKVSRQPKEKQKVLKRTFHKPYTFPDFKNVATYTGSFGNKDRIIATLYRYPSRMHEGSRVKAMMADLTLRQLSELVTKCGAKENKSTTAVAKVEALQDNLKKKEAYSKWIDEHVQALEMTICIQE